MLFVALGWLGLAGGTRGIGGLDSQPQISRICVRETGDCRPVYLRITTATQCSPLLKPLYGSVGLRALTHPSAFITGIGSGRPDILERKQKYFCLEIYNVVCMIRTSVTFKYESTLD